MHRCPAKANDGNANQCNNASYQVGIDAIHLPP